MPPKKRGTKKATERESSKPSAAALSAELETYDEELYGSLGRKQKTTASLSNDAPLNSNIGESLSEFTLQALLEGAAINSIVDALLNVYRSGEPGKAVCAILNVIVKSSGVSNVEELRADQVLIEGLDITPVLEELYARVQPESAAYFLANKEVKYKRFKQGFNTFFERMILLAFTADVLFDDVMMPTLTQWLVTISESKARSFRHTATVAVLGVILGLNKLETELRSRLSLVKSRKETAEIQKKLENVVEWRNHYFSQVVHQRLRDISPEIRLTVVQSLKDWMLDFPDEFLDNKYLRYFGVPLHDKKPELRMEALDMILQTLASVPDAYNRLHLFLKYFVGRLVEMTGDVDLRCAELAIRVIAMMVRGDSEVVEGNELLTEEMVDRALLTIFDERPTVRSAAGILMKIFVHCRTEDEDSVEDQVREATELLISFAVTLRAQYLEEMPEKYLVDALWNAERPPVMLTQYRTLLQSAENASASMECVVALDLISSLLLKLQNRLTVGPVPKDDRRAAHPKKLTNAKQQIANELTASLSQDAGNVLLPLLEKHKGDAYVLQAVANVLGAVDLTACTAKATAANVTAVVRELSKATLNATLDRQTRDILIQTWHALAFAEHPFKTDVQATLDDILRQTLKQLSTSEKNIAKQSKHSLTEAVAVWNRMYLSFALVSGADQSNLFALVKKGITTFGSMFVKAQNSDLLSITQILSSIIGCGMHGCLWGIDPQQPDATKTKNISAARGQVRDYIELLFQLFDQIQARSTDVVEVTDLLHEIFLHICDMAALGITDFLPDELDSFLRDFALLFIPGCEELRRTQDALKESIAQNDENSGVPAIAKARKICSRFEAQQLRLVVGVSRLFLFKRIDITYAPRALYLWAHSLSSKPVSDTFKKLFHCLRDRVGFNDVLERSILLEAYNHCAEVGATPASVEFLYQTGVKLASLHFMGVDRHYETVKQVIQFAIDYAISTDPLILHGSFPYCSKLNPTDAIFFLQHAMSSNELFTSGLNPYVRIFTAAMRRAAKLEEGVQAPGQSPPAKRRRTVSSNEENADALLAEIARGATEKARALTKKNGERMSMSARVITNDGWHVSRDEAEQLTFQDEDEEILPSSLTPPPENVNVALSPQDLQQQAQKKAKSKRSVKHESVVSVPTTQEIRGDKINNELDSEVFIATEEYE